MILAWFDCAEHQEKIAGRCIYRAMRFCRLIQTQQRHGGCYGAVPPQMVQQTLACRLRIANDVIGVFVDKGQFLIKPIHRPRSLRFREIQRDRVVYHHDAARVGQLFERVEHLLGEVFVADVQIG